MTYTNLLYFCLHSVAVLYQKVVKIKTHESAILRANGYRSDLVANWQQVKWDFIDALNKEIENHE